MYKTRLAFSGFNRFVGFFSAIVLTAFTLIHTANATDIPIINGSFEDSTGYDGGKPPTIPGWTSGEAYGQVVDVKALFTPDSGLTGNNAVYLNGNIQQVTSLTFIPGETYTINYDLGRPTNSTGSYGVTFGFRNATNTGFLGSEGNGFLTSTPSSDPGTFQSFSNTYTAVDSDAGNLVTLGITDYFSGSSRQFIDNITATTSAVPEPATYLGGLLCGIFLCGSRCRRSSVSRKTSL